MSELVFCKLGGSVITDKSQPETPRRETIGRLAGEVARSRAACPDLRLVLGHGSGSFGHAAAHRYRTRQGVHTAADWQGFAQVAAAAARLNQIVTESFLEAGVPVWALQPSASAWCAGGQLVSLATEPVAQALAHGLVPLVYGDVALDEVQGGTIVSTEQVLACVARQLRPARLILVTTVDGVFEGDPLRDPAARVIPWVSRDNWPEVRASLGGSYAPDVTGGMASKVEEMVNLARDLPGLTVQILSGERAGALEAALCSPTSAGTLINW